MMERAVIEYIANALWQVPLLAGGAWLFVWAVKPGPRMQYGVWLAVLGLAVALPVHGMGSAGGFAMQEGQVGVGPDVGTVFAPGFAPVLAPAFAPVAGTVLDSREQELESGDLDRPLVKKPAVRRGWLAIAPRVRHVCLAATAVHWLVGVYGAAVLFGMLRVARAWRTARRLVQDSRETTVCVCEMAYLEGYGERLGVRLPRLRESCAVSSPMIVGLVAPVLLLPEGFGRHTEGEVRAALCHELAHVKRRDYLVNLVCQVVALPVVWHPVTYGVQQRIRRTREMVCDAMAAREMPSEISYARCLLAMARSMLGGTSMVEQAEGLGLFGNNILEERVMRLMETKTAMSVRAKLARAASGATMMIAATAMAAMFHVVPTMAEQNTAAAPRSAPVASGVSSPGPQTAPVAPSAPIAPAAPKAPAAPAAPAAPIAPSELESPVVLAPLAPVAPFAPAAPAALVAPLAPLAPLAPVAAPTAPGQDDKGNAPRRKGIRVYREKDADGNSFVIVNGERRELTQEEKNEVDKAVAEAKAQIDNPEFKKQMADAQRQVAEATAKINSPEFKKQIEDAVQQSRAAQEYLDSAEFKKQMEDAHRQMAEATAKINSPEFKKQIEDAVQQSRSAKAYRDSPEFKKQMEDAQRQVAEATAKINSPEFKKQMEDASRQVAEATAKINSPEFKKQIENARKQSAEMKELDMRKMQQQIQEAMAHFNSAEFQQQMKAFQEKVQSGEIQRQIDEAMRKLNETKSHADETPAK
jgi:beta-lactamase regulating signal transducer with metallopeptidase domain